MGWRAVSGPILWSSYSIALEREREVPTYTYLTRSSRASCVHRVEDLSRSLHIGGRAAFALRSSCSP